ncbi:IS607 family transposase [Candidatus Uabimicrobium sp. HlEnr_7]|uniref:IS607 family transposase n=1 Tax=Candidatus Uabimicrobium helgolandensis TaxID=3095367 RepID=UPI0035592B72
MKLSEYAKKNSITYLTAYRHWQKGYIKGKQLPSGTIVVFDEKEKKAKEEKPSVIIYARVSSSENKKNLESQCNRLRDYASARGYQIAKEVKEIGSGLNDKRAKLKKILESDDWEILIVEHKDRLARFGLNYIEILLAKENKKIEVINKTSGDKEDLMQDFVSIITSFCARLYGLRRNKRRTEKIIKELEEEMSKTEK